MFGLRLSGVVQWFGGMSTYPRQDRALYLVHTPSKDTNKVFYAVSQQLCRVVSGFVLQFQLRTLVHFGGDCSVYGIELVHVVLHFGAMQSPFGSAPGSMPVSCKLSSAN